MNFRQKSNSTLISTFCRLRSQCGRDFTLILTPMPDIQRIQRMSSLKTLTGRLNVGAVVGTAATLWLAAGWALLTAGKTWHCVPVSCWVVGSPPTDRRTATCSGGGRHAGLHAWIIRRLFNLPPNYTRVPSVMLPLSASIAGRLNRSVGYLWRQSKFISGRERRESNDGGAKGPKRRSEPRSALTPRVGVWEGAPFPVWGSETFLKFRMQICTFWCGQRSLSKSCN